MNKRIWKWLAATILILSAILLTIISAGAEKPLMPFVKIDRNYADIRQRGTYTHIEGPQSGVTCQEYQFTVINKDDEDSRVKRYNHVVAILDDIVYPDTADTLYSLETTEAAFCFTFYEPGEYVIFSKRYDSAGQIVQNGSYDDVQMIVNIAEGTGTNSLTVAVNTAATTCKKDSEFETAVAINDYLAGLITYDDTKTHYSPQAALLDYTGHKCVCNGYSRAYKLIADACGLQSKRVSGKAGGGDHAWNVVRINGEWYQIDPTWNDSKVNGSYTGNERYWHIYMGLSDAVMGLNHSHFHYPDGTSVTCNTLKDNYFVHTGKWEDLAYSVKPIILDALNAMDGNTGTINADFGNHAYLEVLSDGSRYYTDKVDTLKINGHIVAFALNSETLERTVSGVTTPFRGVFTYSYADGNILTGIMSSVKKTYDMSGAAWNYTAPFIYDGTDKRVVVTGLPADVTVKAYTNNEQRNAGTYTAGVTLEYNAAEYMEPVMPDCEWTIQPKPATEEAGVTAVVSEGLVYDGTAKAGALTVKDGAAELTAGTDYTVTYAGRNGTEYASCDTAPANAGDYTATVTFAGNYSGEKAVPFSIGAREVRLDWTNTALTYNGQEQAPTATAGNLIEGDTCMVTVTGGQTDSGDNYTATASVLSNPNYKLPAENTTAFSIGKATFSLAVTQEGWTYGGEDFSLPIITGLPDGAQKTIFYKEQTAADTDYTETVPINAGSYTVKVTVAGTANYEPAAVTADFTVSPAVLTVSFSGGKIIGVDDLMSPYVEGWKYQDETDALKKLIGISREPGEASGIYPVKFTGPDTYGSNYTVTYKPSTFKIEIRVDLNYYSWRGEVTADKQYVIGVQTISVTVEPYPGYVTEKVTYRYKKENAQDARIMSPDPESGLYQFQTVIDDNAVVEVIFRPIAYTVAFDANGGSGSMEDMAFEYEARHDLIPNAFTRENYEFNGWNTAADGSGDAYRDEETVRNLTVQDGTTVTLYAQWLSKCDIEGHHLTAHPRVEATCTTDGTEAYWECTGCGKLFSDEDGTTAITASAVIPAHHTLTPHATVAATCTTTGNSAYWECTACHKYFSDEGTTEIEADSWVIPALGHDIEHHDAKAATCTEAGWDAYDTCKREGCEYSTKVEIPALGHDVEHHDAKAATCTEASWDAYDTCKCEGCEYSTKVETPALGHDIEHHDAKAATCTEVGWDAYDTCKREGCEYSTKAEIHALDHSWGEVRYEWAEDYSSCKAERICTRDASHTETETVTPEATVVTPATEMNEGLMRYTATFTNPAFPADTREAGIPKLEPTTPPEGSYNDPDGSGNYQISSDGTAEYSGAPANATAVVIPDSITVNNIAVPVVTIADKAFYKNTKVKSVTVGKNIKTIGTSAFNGCKALTTVKGCANVLTIKDNAFSGCIKLKTLPKFSKLVTIGKAAFKGCKELTAVKGCAKVETIGKDAFNGCVKLKTIPSFTSLETIGDAAFKGCKALTVLKGCAKVKAIGKNAFNGCVKLKTIPAFASLTTIGDAAFKGCKTLTKLTLSAGVKKIGKEAFSGCAALKTITIKTTKLTSKNVGANAFKEINKKAKTTCPKSKLKAYKQFLPKRGIPINGMK